MGVVGTGVWVELGLEAVGVLEDDDADVLVGWFDAFEGDEEEEVEEVLLLEALAFALVLPSLVVIVLLLTFCTVSMLPADYGAEIVTVCVLETFDGELGVYVEFDATLTVVVF